MTDTTTRPAFSGADRTAGYHEAPTPPVIITAPPAAAPTEAPPARSEATALELALDLELADVTHAHASVATTGWRGLVARSGIRLAPSRTEQEQLDATEALRKDEETIRQATWTRAVSVLVANPKGGVGKTPVSLLLGGTLAAVRGGSVAILEVSDDPGALAFRAEGQLRRGVGELVRDVEGISSAGQLAGYTAPQTSFAAVIGTVGRRPQLTGDDVTSITAVLDSFYAIRVMDSGNQPSSSAFAGALATTDSLVIPVLNAGDAVLEAVAMLEGLRATGHETLADQATILRLTDGRPEHLQVNERIDRIIASAGVGAVHDIPYDPHIAERGHLTLASLQPATYRAYAAAAATVIRTLQRNDQ